MSIKKFRNLAELSTRETKLPEGVERGTINSRSLELFGPSMAFAKAKALGGDTKYLNNRLQYKWYGRGDYFSQIAKYGLRGLGALGGAALSSYASPGSIGAVVGGARQGWDMGAKLSKAFGYGDYVTNQIVSGCENLNPNQSMHHVSTVDSDLSGDILYSNTEFVKNIFVTSNGTSLSPFNNESFSINPGLSTLFPFLSQLANNFELYEFIGLMFQYKPNSGTFGNSNSNSLGKVVMVTNYDPEATAFTSAIQAENYDYACSTVPAGGMLHGVECHPSQRSTMQLYTRSGTVSKSKIFTDIGLFQIITQGVPFGTGAVSGDEALVGELWVSYTVKLSRAKLDQYLGEQISHASFNLAATTDLGASVVTADVDNHFSVTFTDLSSTTIRLGLPDVVKGRRILIHVLINEANAAGTILSFGTLSGLTSVESFSAQNAAFSANLIQSFDVGSADAMPTLVLSSAVAPDTYTVIVAITVVDPDFRFKTLDVSS